jgi:hypothetical protein
MARLIKTDSRTGVDLTDWRQVLQVTSYNSSPVVIDVRATLGSTANPVESAAGTYDFRYAIDDVDDGILLPDAAITKPVGLTTFAVQFGDITLYNGETLYVLARGQEEDEEVDTVVLAFDVSPYPRSEIGIGREHVDHNYGGSMELAFLENGQGVLDGAIRCYAADDYADGNTGTGFVVAETTTDILGKWREAFMLEPGDYVLVYYKSGRPARTTNVVELTVFE